MDFLRITQKLNMINHYSINTEIKNYTFPISRKMEEHNIRVLRLLSVYSLEETFSHNSSALSRCRTISISMEKVHISSHMRAPLGWASSPRSLTLSSAGAILWELDISWRIKRRKYWEPFLGQERNIVPGQLEKNDTASFITGSHVIFQY